MTYSPRPVQDPQQSNNNQDLKLIIDSLKAEIESLKSRVKTLESK